MRMFEIEVVIEDGRVAIYQEDDGQLVNRILLSAEQAEVVCDWIKGSAKAILNGA